MARVDEEARPLVRLRCSLRFAQANGRPMVIGYPFARLDIFDDVLVFGSRIGAPFVPPRWTVRRDQLVRVERTQRGVRYFATGFDKPWVTASLFPERFLASLREHGIVINGPIVKSRWNTI